MLKGVRYARTPRVCRRTQDVVAGYLDPGRIDRNASAGFEFAETRRIGFHMTSKARESTSKKFVAALVFLAAAAALVTVVPSKEIAYVSMFLLLT